MDLVFDKTLSLFFSLCILANAFAIRRIIGVWLFPACIYSLVWFVMTLIPLVVCFSVPINPLAVGFIALTSIIFSIGSLSFNWKQAYERNSFKPSAHSVFVNRFMRLTLYVSSSIAVASVVIQVMSQGFSFIDLYSNMFEVAGTYAKNRYSGEIESTILSRLGLAGAYLSVLIGGLYFGALGKDSKKINIMFISFFPAIIVMLLQSAKGLLFLSISFFVASIFVTRIYTKIYTIATRTDILFSLTYSIIILPIVVISFLSRGLYRGYETDYVIKRLVNSFASYSSGHLYAFSDWFSNYFGESSRIIYKNEPLSYGFFTFMSFFRFLGDNRFVPAGVYDDYYSYGNFLTSNIYTAFRGMILDFGLLGSLLLIYFFSTIIHFAYHSLLSKINPCVSIALFVLSIGSFYMSCLISIFTWNIISFIFIVFCCILYLNIKINNTHRYLMFYK